MCAGIIWGCSDAFVDAPASEAETRETETFFSKKGGPEALFDDPEDDDWAEELFTSEEWARYDSLRKDIIDRIDDALDGGVEEEELADAFKDEFNGTSNADSTAEQYLFENAASADDFAEEFEAAYEALTTAYPMLVNPPDDPDDLVDPVFGELNADDPNTCEITDETIDDFFTNFDAIYEAETGEGLEVISTPCRGWGNFARYSICTGLCAAMVTGATAGVGAAAGVVLCGWGCLCTFCADDYAGTLCSS